MSTSPPVVRPSFLAEAWRGVFTWFDNGPPGSAATGEHGVSWARVAPFLLLHLGCLGVIWVGWSSAAVWTAVALLFARVFFITAFYHRYFSHRAYRTSRPMQFVFALLGNTGVQRGPIWWAAHHRNHHRYTDQPEDRHSPRQYGFYWSHIGWLTARENYPTDVRQVPDLMRYPELRFLERFDTLVPFGLGAALFGLGAGLERWAPGLGTSGSQMLAWGFFVSTTALFHITCLVNSAAHVWGRQRFDTGDDSRNNWWVALLTFGEGWHNNHHFHPGSVRQGFRWWEIDVTYYLLRLMEGLGIIWDLRPVPAALRRGTPRID